MISIHMASSLPLLLAHGRRHAIALQKWILGSSRPLEREEPAKAAAKSQTAKLGKALSALPKPIMTSLTPIWLLFAENVALQGVKNLAIAGIDGEGFATVFIFHAFQYNVDRL
jgi:hypothetical protein